MKTTKVYKTKIETKLAILMARVKNFFNGSHYVAETFTTKYNKETKEYTLEHFTMTYAEEKQFNETMAEQQAKIIELAKAVEVPTLERKKTKEEKWAEDVERNRQKQLAENKDKKVKSTKTPAKPKTKTTPTMEAKPKRKYNKAVSKKTDTQI